MFVLYCKLFCLDIVLTMAYSEGQDSTALIERILCLTLIILSFILVYFF